MIWPQSNQLVHRKDREKGSLVAEALRGTVERLSMRDQSTEVVSSREFSQAWSRNPKLLVAGFSELPELPCSLSFGQGFILINRNCLDLHGSHLHSCYYPTGNSIHSISH